MPALRCKQCRQRIFEDLEVVQHEKGIGQSAFEYRKRTEALVDCQHIFLDRVSEEQQGKIVCPSCSSKLGQFNLAGISCSCGQWVAPAFAILKSKVDI